VHVGVEAQFAIAVHDEQPRFEIVEQAVVSYCPAAQAPAHATQVSAVPSIR
jgi:hypothetical protein